MFAPSYFTVNYFAPRYYLPDVENKNNKKELSGIPWWMREFLQKTKQDDKRNKAIAVLLLGVD